jgi:hypothetical protein
MGKENLMTFKPKGVDELKSGELHNFNSYATGKRHRFIVFKEMTTV